MLNTSCQKCPHGAYTSSRYTNDALGRERIVYTCSGCGHRLSTPTKDAPGRVDVDRLRKRQRQKDPVPKRKKRLGGKH